MIPEVLYHATTYDNLTSILAKGIMRGHDGVVYFADSRENALRFMALRFDFNEFLVIPVKLSDIDSSLVEESFDHNENFFKCKAWMYAADVSPDSIDLYDMTHHIRRQGDEPQSIDKSTS